MDNIAGLIELYHLLFTVCLVGMFLFLTFSVFLFVRLDMREVISFFTGTQAKREIRELEQSSAKSGRIIGKGKKSVARLTPKRAEKEENTVFLQKTRGSFVIEREVMLIHTSEIIQGGIESE